MKSTLVGYPNMGLKWRGCHYRKTFARSREIPIFNLETKNRSSCIWQIRIEEIFECKKNRPGNQNKLARQIYKRIAAEGYTGSERTVRNLVANVWRDPSKTASITYATIVCREILATSNPLALINR